MNEERLECGRAGVLYACNLQGCAEERESTGSAWVPTSVREREREMMAGLKGMTGALAPFSYLVNIIITHAD